MSINAKISMAKIKNLDKSIAENSIQKKRTEIHSFSHPLTFSVDLLSPF